jgi:signal transduction histidine kinase
LENVLGDVNIIESFIESWVESSVKLVDLMKAIANINSTLDIEEVLALIMESAKRVMETEASSLMMLDKDTGELIISIPTGPVKAELSNFRILPGKGIAGWVATHGEPLIVPDVSVDARFYEPVDRLSGFKTRSILCVPMRSTDGEIIGVIEAINRLGNKPFKTQDISLLLEFAGQAAIAIENARLYEKSIRELSEAKETLVRQDRLAILGKMTGSLCHELRNSIATIKGAVYLLKMTLTGTNEEAKQYLSILDNSINIAEKIVKGPLDFTKVQLLERQEIQISELVEKVLESLTVPDRMKIEQDIPPDLPEVFVDSTHLVQVFTNIIANAIDAMPEGGTLTIRADKRGSEFTTDRSGLVEFTDARSGLSATALSTGEEQSVRVSFTDTGCGISAKNLPKVFEPLFTTKAHGTGFGLAVVRDLLEANDGSVHVESEVGVGTTFTVTLPTKFLVFLTVDSQKNKHK